MRMHYFEPKKGRIEIIPMIDVMFFLLAFFIIVTLQMIPDRGLALVLPQSSEAKVLPRPKVLIEVTADGDVTIKGQRMTIGALTRMLASADPARLQVTIAAAKQVPFQDFVSVMDACRKAGVTDIGIAAQPGS